MANSKTSVVRFLNELNSKEVKSAFEFLSSVLEVLEEKIDPDPIEMEIVDSAYQLIEKLNILQDNLRKYVRSENSKSATSKLVDLYDDGDRFLKF